MVSNNLARSLGYGGSKPVKTKSSIQAGGGNHEPASNASKASNGDLCAASNPHKATYQNKAVTPGSGAKGHGGSIDKKATNKDPQQTGGSKHGK
jgi:hypothetical protein